MLLITILGKINYSFVLLSKSKLCCLMWLTLGGIFLVSRSFYEPEKISLRRENRSIAALFPDYSTMLRKSLIIHKSIHSFSISIMSILCPDTQRILKKKR